LPGRIGRKLKPLRAPLVDRGEDIRPKEWLVADDCNDAVNRKRGRNASRGGDGRLSAQHEWSERNGADEVSDHS
jgi:hypothetical protein